MAAAKVISRLGATGASPSEAAATGNADQEAGIRAYYLSKIDELELVVRERTRNLQRLKAQRNEWNAKGAFLVVCWGVGLGWGFVSCSPYFSIYHTYLRSHHPIQTNRSSSPQRRTVRLLREELYHLQEPGSYVGEVIKAMGKTKVRVVWWDA